MAHLCKVEWHTWSILFAEQETYTSSSLARHRVQEDF